MIIEKNVPMNGSKRGPKASYPFASMDVGDSFFVQDQDTQGRAAMGARAHGQYHGKKFSSRSVEGGVRIWRVA